MIYRSVSSFRSLNCFPKINHRLFSNKLEWCHILKCLCCRVVGGNFPCCWLTASNTGRELSGIIHLLCSDGHETWEWWTSKLEINSFATMSDVHTVIKLRWSCFTWYLTTPQLPELNTKLQSWKKKLAHFADLGEKVTLSPPCNVDMSHVIRSLLRSPNIDWWGVW